MTPEHRLAAAARLLEAHPYPGGTARHLDALLSLCDIETLSPGSILCHEGQPGNGMYFVLTGAVTVQKLDPDGSTRTLVDIQAPCMLGHMALVDHSPRSATCKVREETVIAYLHRDTYELAFRANDLAGATLRRLLAASISGQLAMGNQRLRALVFPDASAALKPVSNQDVAEATGSLEGWVRVDHWGPDRGR